MTLEGIHPKFRAWLEAVALANSKTLEEVFVLWQEYANACWGYGEPTAQLEFLNWYRLIGVTEEERIPKEVTLQTRFDCVRWAIERIHDARARWFALNQDPTSTGAARDRARGAMQALTNEFQLQWGNVEHVLAEHKRVLESVVTIADEALREWDHDRDARAGKTLAALAGCLLNCRADITAIHETLTAARGGERFYPGRHNAKAEAAHAREVEEVCGSCGGRTINGRCGRGC